MKANRQKYSWSSFCALVAVNLIVSLPRSQASPPPLPADVKTVTQLFDRPDSDMSIKAEYARKSGWSYTIMGPNEVGDPVVVLTTPNFSEVSAWCKANMPAWDANYAIHNALNNTCALNRSLGINDLNLAQAELRFWSLTPPTRIEEISGLIVKSDAFVYTTDSILDSKAWKEWKDSEAAATLNGAVRGIIEYLGGKGMLQRSY